MQEVGTVESSIVKGHVPVQLQFMAQATAWRALNIRLPPKMPCERIMGPLPPPPSYATTLEWTQKARRADSGGNRWAAQEFLDKAYAAWADCAEVELAHATGFHPPKWGERSRKPQASWRSILPEKQKGNKEGEVPWTAILCETRRIMIEAVRISRRTRDGQIGHDANDVCFGGDELDVFELDSAIWWCEMRERLEALANQAKTDPSVQLCVLQVAALMIDKESWSEADTDDCSEEWNRRGAELLEQIETRLAQQEKIDAESGFAQWKEWLLQRINKVAKNAHR